MMSNREDRGGDREANRWTPVNHFMLINAQALINMSHKRLCMQAHPVARELMGLIKEGIKKQDEDLAKYLVPSCEYRGGFCPEPKPCGRY